MEKVKENFDNIKEYNKKTKLRKWIFTSFKLDINWEELYLNNKDIIKSLGGQLELGKKTKRLHYQGWIHVKNQHYLKYLRNLLGFQKGENKGGYLAKQLGTNTQVRKYCFKDESAVKDKDGKKTIFDLGTMSVQGYRSDIEFIYKKIKEGKKMNWIKENYFQLWLQYNRQFEKAVNEELLEKSKIFRNVNVHVYYGDSRSGKSRKAIYDEKGIYKEEVFVLGRSNSQNNWWDGYTGQKTLVINDFYGWINYGTFLNILDGHFQRLPVKCNFTYANWNKVIITSNERPDKWYKFGLTEALYERIDEINHFVKAKKDKRHKIKFNTFKKGKCIQSQFMARSGLIGNIETIKPTESIYNFDYKDLFS